MGSFMHTPDGVIVINNEYRFSIDLFKKLEPDYSLPENVISRRYIQEKSDILTTTRLQKSKSIPWKEGDRYISRLSELLYLEQHEKIKEEERREYVDRIKNAKK
jgi:hypothetical protein|tara:strand:- start:4827 stop:5138 length:312 start_codon:yes stop_codon:yes gene_type:complete